MGDGVCICCAASKSPCGIGTAALHAACNTKCRGGSPRRVVHALVVRPTVGNPRHDTGPCMGRVQSMCDHTRKLFVPANALCAPGAPKPSHAPPQVRGLAADGFPASFTSGVVDQIWQDEDIIVPRMRVHYTNVRTTTSEPMQVPIALLAITLMPTAAQ